jgi:hypothetical protein
VNADPFINAINGGIREDIAFNLKHERYRATLILVYSAIDAMAFLNMPESQHEVQRGDFIAWASRYIRFSGDEQLTGEDLYGARCAVLHSYTGQSKMSRFGQCRELVYIHKSTKEPVTAHRTFKNNFLVSIDALITALFRGMDEFLPLLFADPQKSTIAETRLQKLLICVEAPRSDSLFKGFLHGL